MYRPKEVYIKILEMRIMESDIHNIKTKFLETFNGKPKLFRSPGRVNLIGEHTDYNEGFVLPAAIDKCINFAISENGTGRCRIISADMNDGHEFEVKSFSRSEKSWANYLMGVVDQFNKEGVHIGGFDCVFGGNIPIGSGLSSSAALEAGLAFALNEIFNLKVDKLKLVKMAQRAENEFVGVRCGIMDQFINIFGEESKALKIDCRSLEFDYFPFEYKDVKIVLSDSKVHHSLASSEYNVRRHQCEEGVKILKSLDPEIKSLRDVSMELLHDNKDKFDHVVYKRCEYVVEENRRLLDACICLQNHDLKAFGEKMYQSHIGLRDKYEVSCAELDALVEIAENVDGVIGSRMMGGGFGGCTINLVLESAIDSFRNEVSKNYESTFGKKPEFYITQIVGGTNLITV